MRHSSHVKAILCLPLCLALCYAADDAASRAAIFQAIVSLNGGPAPGAFTVDADSELDRLPKVKQVFELPFPEPFQSHPTVTISQEIWGEATISLGDVACCWEIVLSPRISCGAIRFITPEVAVAEGTWKYEDGPATQTIRLLFVMKNETGAWKIASLRVLAPRPVEPASPPGK
jgi:hypothetical protein